MNVIRGAMACGLLLAAASGPADAGVIRGRFTGTVTNSFVNTGSGIGGNINGQTVTGVVRAASAGCDGAFGFCVGRVKLVFDVMGQRIVFGQPRFGADALTVTDTPTQQGLLLEGNFDDPYYHADLQFAGRPDAFIDGTDYATLHAGPVSLQGAEASFLDGRDFGATIALTRLAVRGRPVPIREPGTMAMLMVGLSALGVVRRGWWAVGAPRRAA